jgi:glutathione S-transferase
VVHGYQEYIPTLSEPGLRLRLRQWSGTVSVPILVGDGQIVRGSWDIARFANEHSGVASLGDFSEIAPWHELSERALEEGRSRVVRSVLENPDALEEAVAALFPRVLARPLRFIARDAAARLNRKYAHLVQPGSLRNALVRTRDQLERAGGDFLLGKFSFADITMAVILEMVAPIARTEPPLGPATKACWSAPELAAEFQDLLRWRERLVAHVEPVFSQLRDRIG